MVAAVCGWHVRHAAAAGEIERRLERGERMAIAAHAVAEAYAVLTRLPAPHRLAPADAWTLVRTYFVENAALVTLDASAHVPPPVAARGLPNYWGYSTVGFFSPKAGYAATGNFGMQVDEFKNLVKELHANGIEIWLDVVFNHTAEGGDGGPTINFRGIDNQIYYLLEDEGRYMNYSGTGNTLNCNHPVVRDMVMNALRYWAAEYHIDGFRFVWPQF